MGSILTHGLVTRITTSLLLSWPNYGFQVQQWKYLITRVVVIIIVIIIRHFFLHLFFFPLLKYSDSNRHYLQRNNHTLLWPVKRGVMRLMWSAARLWGPPLTVSAVPVHAAIVMLGKTTVQNVLDVLHYQVDGHCGRRTIVLSVLSNAAAQPKI